MLKGSCECGAVRFELTGPMRAALACHCTQCRKTSGHYFVATAVANADLHLCADAGLAWYQSSANASRGFCAKCGSSLFWRAAGSGQVSVAMGALESPTNIEVSGHIYVADKGDYYQIEDGLPQMEAR